MTNLNGVNKFDMITPTNSNVAVNITVVWANSIDGRQFRYTVVMTISLNDVDKFDVITPTNRDVVINAVDENTLHTKNLVDYKQLQSAGYNY